MSAGGHAHALYLDGDSPVHRLPPQCKLAAQILFVFAVVATPREAFWAFGAYAAAVLAVARIAGIPYWTLAKRLVIEAPFVLFALLLPFVVAGERTEVAGLSLSVEGLWGAWNILAKATLGVAASVIVASTTPVVDFLRGLERLRVPRAFTSTAAFMLRYADVIAGELGRMRIARESRGHDPRWLWQARAVAATAGALFLRSYERGERVYLAMLSRGYAGAVPRLDGPEATGAVWAASLTLPVAAAVVAAVAWGIR